MSEIVLSAVTTGRHSELDWLFRGGLARFFPEEWARLVDELPPDERQDVAAGYHRLLSSPEAETRRRAATSWCLWESATPAWPPTDGLAERFRDPDYALAFSRIVTHYVLNDAFLQDEILLRDAYLLADIPGVLIHGRFDFQAPVENAYALHRAWPRAELVVVDEAGHVPTDAVAREITRATDGFR